MSVLPHRYSHLVAGTTNQSKIRHSLRFHVNAAWTSRRASADPVRGSIVIRRSSRARRDSVCEMFTSRSRRILNPGRDWWITNGDRLRKPSWPYLRGGGTSFGRESQRATRQSRCARASGAGLVRDLHTRMAVESTGRAGAQACLSCHKSLLAGQHAPADECVTCHCRLRPAMWRTRAVTDHRIVRRQCPRAPRCRCKRLRCGLARAGSTVAQARPRLAYFEWTRTTPDRTSSRTPMNCYRICPGGAIQGSGGGWRLFCATREHGWRCNSSLKCHPNPPTRVTRMSGEPERDGNLFLPPSTNCA